MSWKNYCVRSDFVLISVIRIGVVRISCIQKKEDGICSRLFNVEEGVYLCEQKIVLNLVKVIRLIDRKEVFF